jgi:sortase A
MAIGTVMVLVAVAFILNNFLEENRANSNAKQAFSRLYSQIQSEVSEAKETDTAVESNVEYPVSNVTIREILASPDLEYTEIDGVKYVGYLDIPDLELTLPVISEWSYEALKIAPARYSDASTSHGLIIAGHSYSKHFGALSSLEAGAVIYFTDLHGTMYSFEVTELQTLAPTDVDVMVSGDYDLTLFTCTPGGDNRVTVRCEYKGMREP